MKNYYWTTDGAWQVHMENAAETENRKICIEFKIDKIEIYPAGGSRKKCYMNTVDKFHFFFESLIINITK